MSSVNQGPAGHQTCRPRVLKSRDSVPNSSPPNPTNMNLSTGSAVLVYPSPASMAAQSQGMAFVAEPDRAVSPYNFPLSPRDMVAGQQLSPRQGVIGDFQYLSAYSIPPGGATARSLSGGLYSSRLPPLHPGAPEGGGGGGSYGDGAAMNANRGLVVSAQVPTKILAPKELSQKQEQQQQHQAARPGSALPKLPNPPLQPQNSNSGTALPSAVNSPSLGIYATQGGSGEQQQAIAPYTAQKPAIEMASNQQAHQGMLQHPAASSRNQQQQQQQEQQQQLKYGLIPRVPSNGASEHAVDSKHPARTQVGNQQNAMQACSGLASLSSAHPNLMNSIPIAGPSSARPTVVNSMGGDAGSSSGAELEGGAGGAVGEGSMPTTYSRQPLEMSTKLQASSRFSGLNTWGNSPKKPWLGHEGALPSTMPLNVGRDTRSSYGGGPGGAETRSSYGGGDGGRETRSSFGGEGFASPRSNINSRYLLSPG